MSNTTKPSAAWLSLDDSEHLYILDTNHSGHLIPFAHVVDETCNSISNVKTTREWAAKLRDFADKLDEVASFNEGA